MYLHCRLLVLFDDVRSPVLLDHIKRSLLTVPGSRAIVTTRFYAVARAFEVDTGDYVYDVDYLSNGKARELFIQVVGEKNQEKISSRLVEMCAGLPLAIVTMAGQFACNPWESYDEWIKVSGALPPTPSTSHTDYNLTKILSTCYHDMPLEIRTCSLYFSIFPLGYKISRKRLTRRWISDGLVSEQQGMSAEQVAEVFLNHLERRKMLLAVEHSSSGKVKSYQVTNDKVHEYIMSKAIEENFATTIGGSVMLPSSSKIRRLSVQYIGSTGKELETMNLSHVRDMTVFGSLEQLRFSSFKFGVVQVLDLEGCFGLRKQHIKAVYRMLLLKYLSLRRTDVVKLTKRIGDLRYLETLDIRETGVIALPNAICKLERLVNIFGGNKRTRKALKLPVEMTIRKRMKALRILTGIEISEETAADLRHLTNLRKLAIYKLNNDKHGIVFRELCSSIEYLGGFCLCALVIHDESSEFPKLLDDLSVPHKFLDALQLSGKLVVLPKWITEMDTLTKLTLSVTALRTDNLELLSKICSLFSLTFSFNKVTQDEETAATIEDNKACSNGVILFPVGGFENLKLLRLSAPYVPQLSFPDGTLPALERLELRFSNFEGLLGIRGIKNLQQVHIEVLHDEASETTESIVKEMATAAREDREGPRIILD